MRVDTRTYIATRKIFLAASVISSGCPYCLTMLEDGTKAKEVEDSIGTFDVAELLERSVFGEKVKAVNPSSEETEETYEEVVASIENVQQDENTEANAEK